MLLAASANKKLFSVRAGVRFGRPKIQLPAELASSPLKGFLASPYISVPPYFFPTDFNCGKTKLPTRLVRPSSVGRSAGRLQISSRAHTVYFGNALGVREGSRRLADVPDRFGVLYPMRYLRVAVGSGPHCRSYRPNLISTEFCATRGSCNKAGP